MIRTLLALCALTVALPCAFAQVTDHRQINTGTGFVFGNPDDDNEGIEVVAFGRYVYTFFSDEGAQSGNKDLYVAISDDEGRSTTTIVRIDAGNAALASNAENVRAVVLSNGILVAVWEDTRLGGTAETIHGAYSIDGGYNWSMPQLLGSTTDADEPMLETDGFRAYAAWKQAPGDHIQFTRFDGISLSWLPAVDIHTAFSAGAGSAVSGPALSCSPTSVNVVFNDTRSGNQTYVLTSFDQGLSFTETAIEQGALDDSDESYAAQDQDLVVLAWMEQPAANAPDDNQVNGVLSTDGGASFTPEFSLTPEITAASGSFSARCLWFDVAVKGDTIACVYAHDLLSLQAAGPQGEAGAEIYSYVSNDAGQTWVGPTRIGSGPNMRPRVAIGRNGRLHLFFETGIDGANGGAFAWSYDFGATWEIAPIPGAQAGDVDGPEPNGSPTCHAVSFEPVSQRFYSAYYYNAGAGNEIHLAVAKATYLNKVDITGGYFFRVFGAPASGTAYFVGLSNTPGSTYVGLITAMIPFTVDATTIALLDPIFAPLITGNLSGGTGDTLVPIPAVPAISGLGYEAFAYGIADNRFWLSEGLSYLAP